MGSVSRMRGLRIQKSLQKYLGKSKGGGTESTTDGKLGMYGLLIVTGRGDRLRIQNNHEQSQNFHPL